MASSPKTWLITGSSSGFGLTLARTALAHGHNVIATSRNPERTPAYVKEIEASGRGKWLKLDVTSDASTIKAAIDRAAKVFGGIDVVCNNAGYSVLGAAEDIPEDKAKAQFEVNFWGLIRVTQAALPILRAQQSGTIVNISSIGGIHAGPCVGVYAASKFAVEAWSESMSQEVASFGIRVLVVEPGAFRTNFLGDTAVQPIEVSEAYKSGPASQAVQRFISMDGKQANDTVKGCERIVANVDRGLDKEKLSKIQYLRLPLGRDAIDRIDMKMANLTENWASTREEALGLEVDE